MSRAFTVQIVDVVVVGSINQDTTVLTERLPSPGETILGKGHYTAGGGKGANQAVAASRLGSEVALVGRVGDDQHGITLRAALADEGIDISAVGIDPQRPTGIALITIDETAENTIAVSPGANGGLTPTHLDAGLIGEAEVVLTQLEIPLETVLAAAVMCAGTLVLNPAPARALPDELVDQVDLLVPNRSELAAISGRDEPADLEQVVRAVRSLDRSRPTVVTLGADGALIVDGIEEHHISPPHVDPVDPTGAGDAFCGALAHSVSRGAELVAAVRRAVVAGALATTRPGAQSAMPTAREVELALDL
jgi:ribokinase